MINVKNILNRIKNLELFEVVITVPENFEFRGTVPYDMRIVGDQAYVKVYALNDEEAAGKVYVYFYGNDE